MMKIDPITDLVVLRWPRERPSKDDSAAVHPSRLTSFAPQDDGDGFFEAAKFLAAPLMRARMIRPDQDSSGDGEFDDEDVVPDPRSA